MYSIIVKYKRQYTNKGILAKQNYIIGARGRVVVKALCYKPEG
jgi:hypothetical protein